MSLIDYALSHEYQFHPAKSEVYDDSLPIITIHIDAYYGLPYLKEAINSVHDQTYPNVELLLVDNGAQADVSSYLRETFIRRIPERRNTSRDVESRRR
jgi:cellulose synthase/poly-beta-1,6-N-acetylglucosamine synthase-like glycosyltransferase